MVDALSAAVGTLEAQFEDTPPIDMLEGIDPKDPRNKRPDGKLTERGIEICFRLFDAGKTRYAVQTEMDISFAAADNRWNQWRHLGGAQRVKQALD
jgi:hypothetical protein